MAKMKLQLRQGYFTVSGCKTWIPRINLDGSVIVGCQKWPYEKFKKLTLKSRVNGYTIGQHSLYRETYQTFYKPVLQFATEVKKMNLSKAGV